MEDLQAHVIVSDIAMPDDGVDLVRHAMELARSRGTNVPVLAISANHQDSAALKHAGFVEFVPKPLDQIALCKRIRAHVRSAA